MTYVLLAALFLVPMPFWIFSEVSQDQIAQRGDEAAIRKVLDEQSRALKQKDLGALDRLWAADYTFVNPTGQIVTKDQRLKVIGSNDTRIDFINRDEVNIRQYENTAVVISLTSAKGQVAGRAVEAKFRATTVLVKRNEQWIIVSHQDNIVPSR